MSRKSKAGHKQAKARDKERQRRAEARREKRKKKDAQRRRVSGTLHTTLPAPPEPAQAPRARPHPQPVVLEGVRAPAAEPAWVVVPPVAPAEEITSPHGTPAHFDQNSTLHGPVASPAAFAGTTHFSGPLAGPAQFEGGGVEVRGDVGEPAHFSPVTDVPAPVDLAPIAAPARAAAPAPPRSSPVAPAPPAPPPLRLLLVAWASASLVVALGLLAFWAMGRQPAPVPVPVVVSVPPPPVYQPVVQRVEPPAVWPSFDPLPEQPKVAVWAGAGIRPDVALTFDACSTPRFVGWEERVAEVLERFDVPATFFLGGRLVKERPELILRLAQSPKFDLQNHTYLHPHLPEVGVRRVLQELEDTDRAVWELTGRRAFMFRPPFGEYSTEVVKAATARGYLPIQFDVASGDPDPTFHAGRIVESVLTQVRPGSIVVLHANGHGFHTPEALPMLIESLRSRGYFLTTVQGVLAGGGWNTDDGRRGPRRAPPAAPKKSPGRASPPNAPAAGPP